MKIADQLVNGDIELDNEELKFLLWCTLIQLSAYSDDVHTVEEESFDIESVLKALDSQLGMHP